MYEDLFRTLYSAVKGGLLGPGLQFKALRALAPEARPIATKAEQTYQKSLRFPVTERIQKGQPGAGRVLSPTRVSNPEDVARSLRPSAAEMPMPRATQQTQQPSFLRSASGGGYEVNPEALVPGNALVRSQETPRPAFGPNAGPAPVDRAVDIAFSLPDNALGSVQGQLPSLKTLAGLAGLTAAGTAGIGTLINQIYGGGSTPAGAPSLGIPTETIPQSSFEATAPNLTTAQQEAMQSRFGADQVVLTRDDSASNYRQARANAMRGMRDSTAVAAPDMARYPQAGTYYAERARFANQPGMAGKIAQQLQTTGVSQTANFDAWARQNPTLAYELLKKYEARDISQQTPNVVTATPTAELGTNVPNLIEGSTAETGKVLDGANPALKNATEGRLNPSIEHMPVELQRYFSRAGFGFPNRGY